MHAHGSVLNGRLKHQLRVVPVIVPASSRLVAKSCFVAFSKSSVSGGTDSEMPGCRCGNTKTTYPSVSFHRIPKDLIRRATWTEALQLRKETFGSSTRVCSRHLIRNGDPRNSPSLYLGKHFASPIKQDSRAKRAKNREDQ